MDNIITKNPKTSIAGSIAALLMVASQIFPQYSAVLISAAGVCTGMIGLLAHDAPIIKPSIAELTDKAIADYVAKNPAVYKSIVEACQTYANNADFKTLIDSIVKSQG